MKHRVKARFDAWVRKWRTWRALHEQGFAVFCECGELLNHDVYAETTSVEATYIWTCPTCTAVSVFCLDGPTPLKAPVPACLQAPYHDEEPWEAIACFHCGTEYLGTIWAKSENDAYEKALVKFGSQPERMPDGEDLDALVVRRPLKYNTKRGK